jgi:hypothetical protein
MAMAMRPQAVREAASAPSRDMEFLSDGYSRCLSESPGTNRIGRH